MLPCLSRITRALVKDGSRLQKISSTNASTVAVARAEILESMFAVSLYVECGNFSFM